MSKHKKQTVTQTALLRDVEPVSWNRIKLAAKIQQQSLTSFVQNAADVAANRVLGKLPGGEAQQ